VPFPVAISGTNSIITLFSQSATAVKLTTANATNSITPPQNYKTLTALNISAAAPSNIVVTVTMKYPCTLQPGSITPFKLRPGTNTWNAIPFTLNSSTCSVSFNIPPDPVVGIFQNQQYVSTSISTTVTSSIASTASTIVQTQTTQASSSNTMLAVIVIILIVIVVIFYFNWVFRKKQKKEAAKPKE